MTIERPKGLVLNDITIKRSEAPADATDNNYTISEASVATTDKPKMNLLAGLISDGAQGGNTDNYEMLSVNQLDPFYDHPFNAYSEEDLRELAESVKLLGVVNPVIVREKADGRFEILAGHNRTNAARKAGLRVVPCKIVDADDDLAKLIVTDTNLKQRQKLSYSEKARAYKMQLDALKKQGKRKDLLEAIDQENNFGHNVPEVKYARDIVAEMNNTSARQITYYLRLLFLVEGLTNYVDSERIPFRAGVELSYLSEEIQSKVSSLLNTFEKLSVSIQAAEMLRCMSEDDLSNQDILNTLSGRPLTRNADEPKSKQVTPFKTAFKAAEKQFKKIDRYTVESIDEKELEKIVIDAVEEYLIRKKQ